LGKTRVIILKTRARIILLEKIKKLAENHQLDNAIKKLKDENMNLKTQLDKRSKHFILTKMYVIFTSEDGTVNTKIPCKLSDMFVDVEKKLYKKYDYLRNTDNKFTVNGKPVSRFKYLSGIGIKNGDKILLSKIE